MYHGNGADKTVQALFYSAVADTAAGSEHFQRVGLFLGPVSYTHLAGKKDQAVAKLLNIGFGNVVNMDKVVAVVSPDAAPIKRLVQAAKESGRAVDATQGRKTKAVLVTDGDMLVLSALQPETIAKRFGVFTENETKGEYDG